MRILAALAVFAFIGCAAAQPRGQYDLYISNPDNGPDVYAFTGAGHAVAVEIRGCGDVRLIANPETVVSTLRSRTGDDVTRIRVGGGDDTQIGMCDGDEDHDADKDEEADEHDRDSIVIIEHLSAHQTRRMIQTFSAAPEPVRQQLLTALAL